jgi:type IV pilus assembly protein PilV
MITLLILTFGLLALAYMQAWGQRFGQDAGARTQATLIANELLDRIRVSNIAAADAGASVYAATPSGTLSCAADTSSAANDRDCFYLQISQRLPTGSGNISVVGNMYRVTIAWLDRYADRYDAGGDGISQSECEDNSRIWSNDSSIHWYPSGSRPATATCLVVQNWSLMQ